MVEINHRLLLTDYPLNENNPNDSEKTTFEADMVVILAALLCALVAALMLNSAIHIFLRRRRDSINVETLGIQKRDLKKIPVAVFRVRTSVVSATECSICLGDFVDGEKVRVLPICNHEFHVKCVDRWLKEHTSCPNCRRSLVPLKVVDHGDRETVRGENGGMAMV